VKGTGKVEGERMVEGMVEVEVEVEGMGASDRRLRMLLSVRAQPARLPGPHRARATKLGGRGPARCTCCVAQRSCVGCSRPTEVVPSPSSHARGGGCPRASGRRHPRLIGCYFFAEFGAQGGGEGVGDRG